MKKLGLLLLIFLGYSYVDAMDGLYRQSESYLRAKYNNFIQPEKDRINKFYTCIGYILINIGIDGCEDLAVKTQRFKPSIKYSSFAFEKTHKKFTRFIYKTNGVYSKENRRIGFPQVKTILSQCEENEQRFSKDTIVAYHGHASHIQLLQDLNKIKYEVEHKKSVPDDFIFFRDPSQKIREFKNNSNLRHEIYDHNESVKNDILSTSLYVYSTSKGESPWYFAANNHSLMRSGHFEKTLENYGISTECQNELKSFYKECMPASFIQIIIPKSDINTISYISKPYGVIYQRDTNTFINTLHQSNPSSREQWSNVTSNKLQMRLILDHHFFANPDSRIKMHRYHVGSELSPEMQEKRNALLAQARKEIEERLRLSKKI